MKTNVGLATAAIAFAVNAIRNGLAHQGVTMTDDDTLQLQTAITSLVGMIPLAYAAWSHWHIKKTLQQTNTALVQSNTELKNQPAGVKA